MLVLRSLFRPAAAAWLLCSMGTVQADEGVARVSDLRPSVGVASTTALRAAKQDTAAAAPTKPESKAGGCCDENGCGEGDGCCKCTADGCGECGCDGEGCGECGCRGEGCVGSGKNKGKSVGLLNRLFGSHGASSGKNSRSGSGAKRNTGCSRHWCQWRGPGCSRKRCQCSGGFRCRFARLFGPCCQWRPRQCCCGWFCVAARS